MNYLKLEDITKYYGEVCMFEQVEFAINQGEKTALVAKNGTGKTTLLQIITGKDMADAGTVYRNPAINLSYLPQDPEFDPESTVMDAVYASSDNVVTVVREYEEAMLSGDINRIEKAMAEMEIAQAWDFENNIKQVLSVFRVDQLEQKMGQLSGGQRKRVALANIIVNKPDFLILDEPTNHLDLDMIEWLEDYLCRSSVTLLMVTHDRYFLDRVCDKIIEIDNQKIYTYQGNYAYFLEKRTERRLNQQANVEKAKNLMRKELEWIRRQPKARGTKAKYRIDAFHDLKKKASERITDDSVDIAMNAKRMGNKIINVKGLNKAFGSKCILDDFSYNFSRFEKVGIVGGNGTGKSTFLNILTQVIEPDSGELDYGETVQIGYYKQTGFEFKEDQKVIDVIKDVSESIELVAGRKMSASQYLEHFLFEPPMQHVQVSKLSGGERKRLQLMRVLMKQPNFLILDEPTNDLDIETLNILEDFLQGFQGCVIIVSHDRFFMDKVVDHLFVFEGAGLINDFAGNYSDWREYTRTEKKAAEQKVKTESPKAQKPKTASKKSNLTYAERLELQQIEKDIDQLTDEKTEFETKLSSGEQDLDKIQEYSNRVGELIEQIEEKEMRWLELSEKAEA